MSFTLSCHRHFSWPRHSLFDPYSWFLTLLSRLSLCLLCCFPAALLLRGSSCQSLVCCLFCCEIFLIFFRLVCLTFAVFLCLFFLLFFAVLCLLFSPCSLVSCLCQQQQRAASSLQCVEFISGQNAAWLLCRLNQSLGRNGTRGQMENSDDDTKKPSPGFTDTQSSGRNIEMTKQG